MVSMHMYVRMKVSKRMVRPQVSEPVSTRPRHVRPKSRAVCPPTTSVPHTRPVMTQPRFAVGNRRYAAVLSRLSNQTGSCALSSSASVAFSGYVPKCKRNDDMERNNTAARSVLYSTAEQRKTKVSFLQPSEGETRPEHNTTVKSSKFVASSSPASSMTPVSCSETVPSTTAGLLAPSNNSGITVSSVPRVQAPADNSSVSLLFSELFVDNNASFCDQLLENFPCSYEQPQVPHVLRDSSLSDLKQDIPEPVTDFTFDDFVEFDDFFSYN